MFYLCKAHLKPLFLNTILLLLFSSIYSFESFAQDPTKIDPVTITFERLSSIHPSFLYQSEKRLYFVDTNKTIYIAQKMYEYSKKEVYEKPTFIAFSDSLNRTISSLSDLLSYNLKDDSTDKDTFTLKINFTVQADSSISDITYRISKEIFHQAKDCEIEILNTITELISKQKLWLPAGFDSLKVNCGISEEVKIICSSKELSKLNAKTKDHTLINPTTLPEYPGGTIEMTSYLAQKIYNINIPKEYNLKNEHLKVSVQYVIEKDGELTNVNIARGGEKLDEFSKLTIINAFLNMPKWTPAKINDETKRLRFSTTLRF